MKAWLKNLDDILRGNATQTGQISGRSLNIPTGGIAFLVIVLGAVYGACMGTFALFRGMESEGGKLLGDGMMQMLASAVKVPLMFLLTLLVTFPSLYVFNALIGSQLGIRAVLKLLVAALGVNLAVLASLGPIVAFFSASSPSYSFILLLNVLVFVVAGTLSLIFLFQTLKKLSLIPNSADRRRAKWQQEQQSRATMWQAQQLQAPGQRPSSQQKPTQERPEAPMVIAAENTESSIENKTPDPMARPEAPGEKTTTPNNFNPNENTQDEGMSRHVRLIFTCWIFVYGLVGAQMGWVLRPFVGSPNSPFEWFRERDGSFFEGVWRAFHNLFG